MHGVEQKCKQKIYIALIGANEMSQSCSLFLLPHFRKLQVAQWIFCPQFLFRQKTLNVQALSRKTDILQKTTDILASKLIIKSHHTLSWRVK